MKRSLSKKTLNHPTVMQRQFFNYSLFPIPCSLFPVPYSLFPIPCSLFPVPCSLFPTPCSLFPTPCSPFCQVLTTIF
ncbi:MULTISPECIES: hypothetical protein [Moorena]|uniref:hypothetical protein n=1 Tax=Moorena TaxID=1155738 RepID=UPI0002F76F2E|nr:MULTISPECIES: hypothetical protein [Moorena]NEP67977.1 hypothetical protein [Moorena sp. SIO3A5]NER90106.1 hypothetical protein [Moorena sp. SIO3A2]NES44313.1 hypothetical protein [Moorena sp. SIO2C4]NET68921.1 hypothetical protein [Moorena sp. SIO1G6]